MHSIHQINRIVLNVARAELLKLRRRSLIAPVLLSFTVLAVLLLEIYFHALKGKHHKSLALTPINTGFNMLLFFLGILAICISASYVAGEYSYGTLRNLLVRAPSRLGVILGKFLAHSLLNAALVLYIYLLTLTISLLSASSDQRHMWMTSPAITHSISGFFAALAGTIAFSLFGLSLGLIFRSPMVSISVGILWSLIIESAISGSLPKLAHWMPAANFESLSQGGSTGMSLLHSSALSLIYLAVLVAPAIYLFLVRDV